MWRWIERLMGKEEIGVRMHDAYDKGFYHGVKRRGYIHDHPENVLPYKNGTPEAEKWMAGYQAGIREDGDP